MPGKKTAENSSVREDTGQTTTGNVKLSKIIAYGFETYGFKIPDGHIIKTDRARILFNALESSQPLDAASGVIVPSGIFERFEERSSYMDGTYINVYCKRDLLLQREREILNLINGGGWICGLVDKIVDEVKAGYGTKKCNDTDLVKTLLNSFDIRRQSFKGSAIVFSKNDEFMKYIEKYGVAKTILEFSYKEQNRKILAVIGDAVVGAEFSGNIYFLPLHTTNFSLESGISLVTEVSTAILDYRQKRLTEVPDWVSEFSFRKEDEIKDEVRRLIETANQLQQELSLFKSYKGILTQSGDTLKDTVVTIIRDYFSLKVTDVEDFKEDAIIRDEDGKPLVVIEIKGTKSGVKRKHINQLDSNRERVDLNSTTSGLLIINDQMSVENITERQETSVSDELIKHAKNTNILILRTMDLLLFMKTLEDESKRGEHLLKYCNQGGGHFVIEDKNIKIAT